MRVFTIFIIIFLLVSCTRNNKKQTLKNDITTEISTEDSLEIINSKEYVRVIEFLNWYKKGYNNLRLSVVEKEIKTDTSYYCYVDSLEGKNLLNRYRVAGFFTEKRIRKDSIEIETAKRLYAAKDMEIYDYFNHDFVFMSQETVDILKNIPKTQLIPKMSNLKTGKITVKIGNSGTFRFYLIQENGRIKIQSIE